MMSHSIKCFNTLTEWNTHRHTHTQTTTNSWFILISKPVTSASKLEIPVQNSQAIHKCE